uniref:Uncharacterized protein n=1 Tax=Oryza sativa subsp. japonica TaxID=39947 RepID=Q654M3_ORYSJ|nr:hypothetical protein [Oryza sativa Japonica Group]
MRRREEMWSHSLALFFASSLSRSLLSSLSLPSLPPPAAGRRRQQRRPRPPLRQIRREGRRWRKEGRRQRRVGSAVGGASGVGGGRGGRIRLRRRAGWLEEGRWWQPAGLRRGGSGGLAGGEEPSTPPDLAGGEAAAGAAGLRRRRDSGLWCNGSKATNRWRDDDFIWWPDLLQQGKPPSQANPSSPYPPPLTSSAAEFLWMWEEFLRM